jgi:hypothetical protein
MPTRCNENVGWALVHQRTKEQNNKTTKHNGRVGLQSAKKLIKMVGLDFSPPKMFNNEL